MPIWFGDALGSAVGLVAILLGALYNAHLSRERDDTKMDKEAKAIACAIGAEMAVYLESLCGHYSAAMSGPNEYSAGRMNTLKKSAPMVWPRLADQVGKLDYELSYKTVKAWSLIDFYVSLLDATVEEMKEGTWTERALRNRTDAMKRDLPMISGIIEDLTGRKAPDLEYALP